MKESATKEFRRHGGGFGGLSPPKQSSKPPQIEIWNSISRIFVKFACLTPLHEC